MKKRSTLFALGVMVLALAITLVGVAVAWFGDVFNGKDTVIITSYAPTGSATVSMNATTTYLGDASSLMPAIIGTDANGTSNMLVDDGSGMLDSLDVLDPSLVANGTLKTNANTVSIKFSFMYGGTLSANETTKKIRLFLNSATLSNPRQYITVAQFYADEGVLPSTANLYTRSGTEGSYVYTRTTQEINSESTDVYVLVERSDLVNFKSDFGVMMDLSGCYIKAKAYDANDVYYYQDGSDYKKVNPQPVSTDNVGSYYILAPFNEYTATNSSSVYSKDVRYYSLVDKEYVQASPQPTSTAQIRSTVYYVRSAQTYAPAEEYVAATTYYTYSSGHYTAVTMTDAAAFEASFATANYFVQTAMGEAWTKYQTNETLYIYSVPYRAAVFEVTLYFRKVDEEISTTLNNATVYFNFNIDVEKNN